MNKNILLVGIILVMTSFVLASPIQITANVFSSDQNVYYSSVENSNSWKSVDFNIIVHDLNFGISGKQYARYKLDSSVWVDFTIIDGNDYYAPIVTDGAHLLYFDFKNNFGNDLNFSVLALLGKTPAILDNKSPVSDLSSTSSVQTFIFDFNSLTTLVSCDFNLIYADSNILVSTSSFAPVNNGGNSFSCSKQYSGLGVESYRVDARVTNLAGIKSSIVESSIVNVIALTGGGGGGGGYSTGSIDINYPASTSIYLVGSGKQSFTIRVKNVSGHPLSVGVTIDDVSYGVVVARTPRIELNIGEAKDIVFDVQETSNGKALDSTVIISVVGTNEGYPKLFHVYYSPDFLTALFSGFDSGSIVGGTSGGGTEQNSTGILLVIILAIVVLGFVFLSDKKRR